MSPIHYTYRLDAPRVFGGTRFPAGSEVSTDPDGQPVHGKIPVPTTVLGLELVGAFRAFQGTSLSYVESGTLASEGLIDGVPCGPGPFDHPVIDTRALSLARNTQVAGVVLRAGTVAEIEGVRDRGDDSISGTLAQSAQFEGPLLRRATDVVLSCR